MNLRRGDAGHIKDEIGKGIIIWILDLGYFILYWMVVDDYIARNISLSYVDFGNNFDLFVLKGCC